MLSLNDELRELEAAGTPIRVGLVGAGAMGAIFVSQLVNMPGVELDVVADVNVERARASLIDAGVADAAVVVCDSVPDILKALKSGKKVCTRKYAHIFEIPTISTVVDSTGVPEVGAEISFGAIRAGKHIVTLNIEMDSAIGHILNMFATRAGLVYTGIYGDEPGEAMELYCLADALGFKIIAAGRSEPEVCGMHMNPETVKAELAKRPTPIRNPNYYMFSSFYDGSKTNEEMTVLANATGLVPDVRGMHGPVSSFAEAGVRIPKLLSLKSQGGILNRTGVVEYVKEPGDENYWFVFVVISTDSKVVAARLSNLAVRGTGPNWLLYKPYHLLSITAPVSVAHAAMHRRPTIAPKPKRVAECITIAKKDLAKGDVIDEIGGYCSVGRIEEARVAREGNCLPLALAKGATLLRDIPQGTAITYADVAAREDTLLFRLRQLQDMLF